MRDVVQGLGLGPLSIAPILMLVAAALGTATATETALPSAVVGLVALPAAALVGYVAVREGNVRLGPGGTARPTWDRSTLATVVAVAAGAPLTRLLAVDAGLGVVVASALVGLVAGVVVPAYGPAVYCGSFVGMAAPEVLGFPAVAAAGGVAGAVLVAATGVFDGFGGKLGTTAFVGCAVVALATGASTGTGSLVDPTTAVGYVLAGAAAAVVTVFLSVRLDRGPVQASGLVGLAGGLGGPLLGEAGTGLAAVVFCASFAGMARPARVPGVGAMAVAGALCGLLVAATGPVFVGMGGKLGTVAFTACLLVRGLLAVGSVAVPLPVPTPADDLAS